MPDLTTGPDSYIAANYRRALDNFSQFGTRKLAFYAIYVYGLSDATVDSLFGGEDNYNADGQEFPPVWIEEPGNILEAVHRGVQLMAEPFYYGDWDVDSMGPDYNNLYLTVAVAANTVMDGVSQQNDSPVPANQNSYTFETAILDAISNFTNDGVNVERGILRGDYFDSYDSNALGRRNPTNQVRRQAQLEARIAAGKPAVKRNV